MAGRAAGLPRRQAGLPVAGALDKCTARSAPPVEPKWRRLGRRLRPPSDLAVCGAGGAPLAIFVEQWSVTVWWALGSDACVCVSPYRQPRARECLPVPGRGRTGRDGLDRAEKPRPRGRGT